MFIKEFKSLYKLYTDIILHVIFIACVICIVILSCKVINYIYFIAL